MASSAIVKVAFQLASNSGAVMDTSGMTLMDMLSSTRLLSS